MAVRSFLTLAASAALQYGNSENIGSRPSINIPKYSVDLSKSPAERWTPVLQNVLNQQGVKPFVDFFDAVTTSLQQRDSETYSFYQENFDDFVSLYAQSYPDSLGEMRALADVLQAHAQDPQQRSVLEWKKVFIAQVHMQIMSIGPMLGECTSVVLRPPHGHAVLHMRNWDFGPKPDALGSLSVTVDFTDRDGETFTCLMALTHITKWTTCVRPKSFSMSLNARMFGMGDERGRKPQEELRLLREGRAPREEVLRAVMLSKSYKEALATAASVRPLTSMYVILADGSNAGVQGLGGAVVTVMGNGSSADVWPMARAEEPDGWFLVQTNVDHWVPMAQTAYSSHRRDHVMSSLRSLGPNATTEQFFQVLQDTTVFPAGNPGPDDGRIFRNSTIASVMMAPGMEGGAEYHPALWRAERNAALAAEAHVRMDAEVLV